MLSYFVSMISMLLYDSGWRILAPAKSPFLLRLVFFGSDLIFVDVLFFYSIDTLFPFFQMSLTTVLLHTVSVFACCPGAYLVLLALPP